jgi:hypothetical protein
MNRRPAQGGSSRGIGNDSRNVSLGYSHVFIPGSRDILRADAAKVKGQIPGTCTQVAFAANLHALRAAPPDL